MQYQKNHLCVCFLNISLKWTYKQDRTLPLVVQILTMLSIAPARYFPVLLQQIQVRRLPFSSSQSSSPRLKIQVCWRNWWVLLGRLHTRSVPSYPLQGHSKKWERGKVDWFVYYNVFLLLCKRSLSYKITPRSTKHLQWILCTCTFSRKNVIL